MSQLQAEATKKPKNNLLVFRAVSQLVYLVWEGHAFQACCKGRSARGFSR